MTFKKQEKQVVSKKRVADHGEVYTAKREVTAMLDLLKQETERIDSRFLEPACGHGNFLAEVLNRKLHVVETRYRKSQLEYERYSVIAVSSIYGIDIQKDNVVECRNRLFEIFNEMYNSFYKKKTKEECKKAVKYILERNIIWGDALTLKTVGENAKPIVFSEWSPVNGSMIKRRDYAFHELLPGDKIWEVFHISDLGEKVFIPEPIKKYPLMHFLRLAYVDQ
ncbi:MAG: DNA methyltransferase [Nitrospirota bacterium]